MQEKGEAGIMFGMRKYQTLGSWVYEPTPLDIRRACAQIQATWSPRERIKRSMMGLSALVEACDRLSNVVECDERAAVVA